MTLRLRQVALVAADLDEAEDQIESELGLEPCFRDPGVAVFGLHNVLYPVGDRLLEVVSPTEQGTTAGRLLDKRGGDGGYMVILQTDDLAAAERRFDDVGVRVVFRAEGDGVVGLHLHPRDVGGAIVSIDETDEWEEWPWAGSQWRSHRRDTVVTDLVAVEVQTSDPEATAERWAAVLGVEAEASGPDRSARRIVLDEGEIRFARVSDGRGDGVSAIELRAGPGVAERELELVGCRVVIRSG